MEKRFATFISYIAHPLLIPVLGLLIISNSGTYAADIDQRYKQFIYLAVFIFTLLLPSALIPLFYYFGLVKNVQISERRERLIPLYLTLIFYLAAYFFIKQLPVSVIYQQFIFSACVSMVLLTAISYFWKISAHLVGWGGLTGLIVMLSLRFNTDLMLFLIVAILFSGLVAYARLKVSAHKPSEVYSGFALGFLVMVAVFILK
jgi:hypothetical protein